MSKSRVTLLRSDGWSALYVNDECVDQRHRYDVSAFFEALRDVGENPERGFSFECRDLDGEVAELIHDAGGFPNDLDKFTKLTGIRFPWSD